MVNPKFTGLPYIAVDEKEVYESELQDNNLQQTQTEEEKFDSDCIEKVNINLASALGHFRTYKPLDANETDFSDHIDGLRRKGYSAGPTVINMVGAPSLEPETPMERYDRLKQELSELHAQIQRESQQGSSAETTVNAAAVIELQSQLAALNIRDNMGEFVVDKSKKHGRLLDHVTFLNEKISKLSSVAAKDRSGDGSTASGYVTYDIVQQSDKQMVKEAEKVANFENRIKRLEKLLGGDKDNNLVGKIKEVSEKVEWLDKGFLEMTELRLSAVMQKLAQQQASFEKKASSSLDGASPEAIARVNEQLYDKMSRCDAIVGTLPNLADRLYSMRELHEQAADVSRCLIEVDGTQQYLMRALESDSAILNEVKNGLRSNLELIQSNCASVDSRLANLTK